MSKLKFLKCMSLGSTLCMLSLVVGLAWTQNSHAFGISKRPTHADRQAAADRAAAKLEAAGLGGNMFLAVAQPGDAPRYFTHPNYMNSPLQGVDILGDGTQFSVGIRKFVDGLPGLTSAGMNNLGQYISVPVPDDTTYPGSDYYEIAVVEFMEQLHSDLPATKLRGYVQLETPFNASTSKHVPLPGGKLGYDDPHYLGTTIVAQKDRPVRIKFYNLLPTGMGGNLFVPTDATFMGAGMSPNMFMMGPDGVPVPMPEADWQNPMCTDKDMIMPDCFPENRATLHLHGGITPWISDGTPHQWITPAGEPTNFPQGVSVQPVPDMGDDNNPTDGTQTYYYTNQQSARLLFYHDHAWGITRLNVYVGEAAGYLIRDAVEQLLLTGGLIPADEIPLVFQDKTFVPDPWQIAMQDETWDSARWGAKGNLWFPHVYVPAQNPGDLSGFNAYGRWMYGSWFWPPTNAIDHGPIPNPYYGTSPLEPLIMPGTPFNSAGMEAFNDTPLVNGTAYPVLEVEPKAYRFRILSAANDRFFNLSWYKAVDAIGVLCDENTNPAPIAEASGVACTEVNLNPLEVTAALTDPTVFPTPVAGTEGPDWIQIGTEGGFLPAPVVIPAHPTTWVNDPTLFNAGNVDLHSLLLGPAERADVIVDFSAFAGQTLILYNDAPAAFPARDPRYDYYTGSPDLTDTGGVPTIPAGYGPNTRTVMQVKVANTGAAPAFGLPALEAAFAHQADNSGVFESAQKPIIIGQQAYNSAYGTAFPYTWANIFDFSLTFQTLLGTPLSIGFQNKMIQDEMGEAFEKEYGRMQGNLGLEVPNAQAGLQNMILYPYSAPPTEVLAGLKFPVDGAGELQVQPIASADDGTQIWKITHNGVDTHPMHWHLYDVQLINRVGWDNGVRLPDPNEVGWKDTVRVSPLEDTIVAVRPIMPVVPFDLPNSVRPMSPMMPIGAYLVNSTAAETAGLPILGFAPDGEPIDIINHVVNFGWEYVWHCHILSHEEMDMMRPQAVALPVNAPSGLGAAIQGSSAALSWVDNSSNETSFIVQRSDDGGATWVDVGTVPEDTTMFADAGLMNAVPYNYRVVAQNQVGDTWDYSNPNFNEIAPGSYAFPVLTMESFSGVIPVCALLADFNNDGRINQVDFAIFRQNYGTTGPTGDINGDGLVNQADLVLFRQYYGTTCP
ncbi:MAG: multicopper oxidase domain-containing protein [Deltaproteobacteria bacterium]|nr:multicopper oxidase domain-containing protein [Deltaproteobacteria bacterium]